MVLVMRAVCKEEDDGDSNKGNGALSPLVNLETAQQERNVLLADDKRLLRERIEVDSLSNQKGNYEQLKLILIRLKCMCILPGPPKRCT
jgi:hypothetical protein